MSEQKDLGRLLGEPKKAILSMVVPFLIAASVVQINQFADTFWVSGLGNVAGASVATITPVYGLLVCAGLGIGVGATTTIAYRLGRHENDAASHLAAQSIILGTIFAVIGSVAAFILFDPIIELLGAQDVRNYSFDYILPFLLMSPVLLTEMILGGILRGEGAARKSTVVQMSASLFNMVIDPILIYGLDMGIAGAGLSTCVSALIALGIGSWWYLRRRTTLVITRKDFRIDKVAMGEVMNIGGPRTGQSLISNLTDLIQRIFLIIAGGTNAVMFYNYSWRYIGLVELPTQSFDTAMVPVCSAAHGQNDPDKMRVGFRYTVRCTLIISTIMAAVLFFLAEPLISILTYESSMHALKDDFVWTLRVSALLLPMAAMMGVGSSMLQALKRSRISMNYYLVWGLVKLCLYAAACTISFEAIIYCMVAVHWFGGSCFLYIASREYGRQYPGRRLVSFRD